MDCEGVYASVSGTEWSCSNCKKKKKSEQCEGALEKLDTELKIKSEVADFNRETVLEFEQVIHLDILVLVDFFFGAGCSDNLLHILSKDCWLNHKTTYKQSP